MPTRTWFSLVTIAALGVACNDSGGEQSMHDSSGTSAATEGTSADTNAATNASGMTGPDPTDTSAGPTGPSSSTETSDTTGSPVCPYTPVEGTPGVTLQLVGSGFNRPVLAVGHPTEPDRLFVVEQSGDIRILEPGQTEAPRDVWLHVDVAGAGNTTVGDERGLLGFAFHPDYPRDPRVYVSYSPASGGNSPATTVEEYTVGPDETVDMSSARVVIAADQPAANHNGGMIAFGPDGYLYFATGDGGQADDAFNTGRNPSVILAKMLRIGVDPDGQPDTPQACVNGCQALGPFDYTIPPDNPFVNDANVAPEVWALGFRNPWRFYFDPDNGRLYLGDVGQGTWEEVNVVEAGKDYGWSDLEGNHCFNDPQCDTNAGPNQENSAGLVAPIAEYNHQLGCSITALGIYRSCEVPGWDGVFFYGDYCSGRIWGVYWDGNDATDLGEVFDSEDRLLGGGWNAYGDVFVTTAVIPAPGLPFSDGRVYRLAPN